MKRTFIGVKGFVMYAKRLMIVALLCLAADMPLSADVVRVEKAPDVDGKLDDAAWAVAKWEGGFRRLAREGFRGVKATVLGGSMDVPIYTPLSNL